MLFSVNLMASSSYQRVSPECWDGHFTKRSYALENQPKGNNTKQKKNLRVTNMINVQKNKIAVLEILTYVYFI